MANWAAEFVPPSTGAGPNGVSASPEHLLLIGRWGEALCYQLLVEREAARHLADPTSPRRVVQWLNETAESGQPFDIVVSGPSGSSALTAPDALLIEVKTSVHTTRTAFDISAREVACALDRQTQFQIWRVTGAGTPHAQVRSIERPALAWHRKEIRVVMEI